MTTRLFLVAPADLPEADMITCAAAACTAADCATILVPEITTPEAVASLQGLNLAVLLKDVAPIRVQDLRADGLMLSNIEAFKEARLALKNESLGFLAGVSRHAAMEAAEAGADFMLFTQSRQYAGEPIIGWWQDVTDVPSVAFDPVTDAALQLQRPDFIRPSDDMWQNAKAAAQVVSDLNAKWQS
jgi:thiamine-phosphate pyrophosphorylase